MKSLSKTVSDMMRHPLSPFKRKTMISIIILVLVMFIGTEGMVLLEQWSYVDAFYYMSLLATTQGPTRTPATDIGKIFGALMSFISVGAVLSSVAFVFGPLFGTILKVGIDYLEKEEQKLKHRPEQRKPISDS